MDPDVRLLLDYEDIKQLKARYLRFVDQKDWTSFRQLFTNDAVFDFEGMGRFESADAFVESVSSRNAAGTSRTVHHGHTPEISVDGDDGRAIWPLYDYVDRILDGEHQVFHGYGYYEETYRRLDDGWRIASSRLIRLRRDEVHV